MVTGNSIGMQFFWKIIISSLYQNGLGSIYYSTNQNQHCTMGKSKSRGSGIEVPTLANCPVGSGPLELVVLSVMDDDSSGHPIYL